MVDYALMTEGMHVDGICSLSAPHPMRFESCKTKIITTQPPGIQKVQPTILGSNTPMVRIVEREGESTLESTQRSGQ